MTVAGGEGGVDRSGFVVARGPALVGFAHALCGDRQLAEDLVQDALSKVLRRYGHRLPLDNPEAYLRDRVGAAAVAPPSALVTIPFFDLEPATPPGPPSGRTPGQPDAHDGDDIDGVVWAALAGLPYRQRAVLSWASTRTRTTPRFEHISGGRSMHNRT